VKIKIGGAAIARSTVVVFPPLFGANFAPISKRDKRNKRKKTGIGLAARSSRESEREADIVKPEPGSDRKEQKYQDKLFGSCFDVTSLEQVSITW
jgi:hypothetical protein